MSRLVAGEHLVTAIFLYRNMRWMHFKSNGVCFGNYHYYHEPSFLQSPFFISVIGLAYAVFWISLLVKFRIVSFICLTFMYFRIKGKAYY